MQLSNEVAALLHDAVLLRQKLHRIPETAFEEFETRDFVLSELRRCNPDEIISLSETGLKAIWYAKNPKSTIAFRADMDALNMEEANCTDYVSEHPGKMHGCGHDGHMTMLLLLAKLINRHKAELENNIVLIFQPAEEGKGGARIMINAGALKNPDVDRIYGMHLWPAVPKGKIGVRWGEQMSHSCELDIIAHGRSAHGASPQKGVDAVVATAEFISMMQAAITRSVDPHQDALLTIGRINGGVARNIIADRVEMNATLRVFSSEVYDQLMTRIHAIAEGLGLATGAKFEINELMQYPCVYNPRWLVEDFYTYMDMDDIVLVDPAMASEDFACYQQEIPGLFLFLGVGGGKNTQPLHNIRFDFDEDVLLIGTEIYRRLAGLGEKL
jgi:amidohydrolase